MSLFQSGLKMKITCSVLNKIAPSLDSQILLIITKYGCLVCTKADIIETQIKCQIHIFSIEDY